MKRVFTNADDVIHLFAQQAQSDARSSNVFFEKSSWRDTDSKFADSVEYGTKLYSYGYHYLLAYFIDKDTIFINDDGYSVTTSKHISQVSYATRQYRQFYKSKSDLKTVYDQVMHNLDKLGKARKKELYIFPIMSLKESLDEHLRYTKTISKAKKTKEYRYIDKVYNELKEDAVALTAKIAKAQKEAKEILRKKNEAKLKEALPKFNNYEIDSFRIGDEDYLRLSQCGEYVETSQNVRVTAKEAKLLYQLIQRGTTIRGHRIGGYTVTSINGTLKIGCHNINIGSVYTVGNLL